VVPPPIVTLSSDLLQSSAVEPSTAPPSAVYDSGFGSRW
jgi:hypothetical protein